jgi:hypothetical protein
MDAHGDATTNLTVIGAPAVTVPPVTVLSSVTNTRGLTEQKDAYIFFGNQLVDRIDKWHCLAIDKWHCLAIVEYIYQSYNSVLSTQIMQMNVYTLPIYIRLS